MTNVFQQWLPLHRLAVVDSPQCGDRRAVYALREATTGQILKFGSTGRLRRRILWETTSEGLEERLTLRIHGELFTRKSIDHVELAWPETKDKAEAEGKERVPRRL